MMSRLVVKNLPDETSEKDLHNLFSQMGAVTDVDLKRNSRGRSRHFAFIGFHNDRDADEAIRLLNHTFINTNKIQIDRCSDLPKDGPRRKFVVNHFKVKRGKKIGLGPPVIQQILVEKYKSDPDFAEYLDLKSPIQAAKVRAFLKLPKKHPVDRAVDPDCIPFRQQKLKRREVINLLYHVKLKKLPKQINKTDVREFFHPLDCKSIRLARSTRIGFVGFLLESERKQALAKDKSFIKGESVRVLEYNEDYKRKRIVARGPETQRLYFYDLPSTVSTEEIKKMFSVYGELKSIVMPRYANDQLKGFGLVTYVDDNDAKRAFAELEQTSLKDKLVISPEHSIKVRTSSLEECLQELGETLEDYQNDEENEQDDSPDEDEPKRKKWKQQEDSLKNEECVAESGRVFLRNLSYTTQESDIEKLFGAFGPISEINLPIDSDTKQLKGFGIVTFLMPEHAVKAFKELDGTVLHGRMLHLLPGKSKDKPDVEESSNFKDKKLSKQKAQAGKAHNWNALFVDHNAVAEVVAEKFGKSKEAILGPEIKGSAAVRLALAETQIVNETKKYLEEMGVKLDAFNENQNVKRSKTIILVKNLPSKTESKELKEIFGKHGHIGRLILPPNGLTAIIEFLDPSEARKAFTCLAYSKFKHVPLYLEWAPEGSLNNYENKGETTVESKSDQETSDSRMEVGEEESKITSITSNNAGAENNANDKTTKGVVPEGNPEPETTIFVKNLNFQTRNDALRTHFEQIGPLYYAYVVMKKINGSKDASELSRGYGFVRYMLKSDADRAIQQLQQSSLDGKSLELAKSDRAEKNESEIEKKNQDKHSLVKLIVKNIPFAAKTKEVQEIFSTFGGLKRVKLPKKLGAEANRHRGFAFVEFTNESDAKAAYEALHLSTHLLGRRLVLEWAKDDEDVDEIRKKTEEHYAPQKKVESKKSVFKID